MAWLPVILLVLATGLGLGAFLRRDRGALQFLAAALLLALAGYSWQGRPSQAGSPKHAQAAPRVPDDDFAILQPALLGRAEPAAAGTLAAADAERRAGDPRAAAERLEAAVRAAPRSAALWIAYGYALVAANGNLISPASLLAFERAEQLAPSHPASMFFYGLAISRTGDWVTAERIWRAQLRELGNDVPLYRAAIEDRLAAIEQARTTGSLVPRAMPPRQGAPAAAN